MAPSADAVHTVELPASHLKEMSENTIIALLFVTGEREHLRGVASDWTPTLLRDFARYCNRHLWRTVSLHAYRPRKSQLPPFAPILG